jgi:3-hydroxyisobutyrate dehydrogenase-like beta-hydroxyacid dehydrogenase
MILILMLQGTVHDSYFAISVAYVVHPGFYVNHFVKDLGNFALEECKQMGLALPGLALVILTTLSFPRIIF